MTDFSVQLESLVDVVDQVAAFEARLEQQLDELRARTARLHATWAGAAADEHRTIQDRWDHGASDMHDAVAVLRRAAATAHANYSAAVHSNRQMWA